MARLIEEKFRHSCHEELKELGDPYLGSTAECSCGKRFVRRDDQRDGLYWEEQR